MYILKGDGSSGTIIMDYKGKFEVFRRHVWGLLTSLQKSPWLRMTSSMMRRRFGHEKVRDPFFCRHIRRIPIQSWHESPESHHGREPHRAWCGDSIDRKGWGQVFCRHVWGFLNEKGDMVKLTYLYITDAWPFTSGATWIISSWGGHLVGLPLYITDAWLIPNDNYRLMRRTRPLVESHHRHIRHSSSSCL